MLKKQARNPNESNPRSLNIAIVMWAVAYGAYLLAAVTFSSLVDKAEKGQPLGLSGKAAIAIFVLSLVTMIGATIFILLKLRPVIKQNEVTPEQRKFISYALCSLLGALFGLFFRFTGSGGLIFGIIALKHSYREENKDLQMIKTYRRISLVSIAATSVHIVLIVIISRL